MGKLWDENNLMQIYNSNKNATTIYFSKQKWNMTGSVLTLYIFVDSDLRHYFSKKVSFVTFV